MAVLVFGFSGGKRNPHRVENLTELLVAYTGTHDTVTAVGWWDSLTRKAQAATGLDPAEPQWSLIGLALDSPAVLAMIPAQDVLGLGNEARMNRPGTTKDNWIWRLGDGDLTPELAARLRSATERAGRLTS